MTDRRAAWQGVLRLLAVRTDGLGDVLMTTPALAALRQRLPHAHVTLLTSRAGAKAAPHIPVDAAWACEPPWTPHHAAATAPRAGPHTPARPGREEIELVGRIAEGRFDGAVVFTVCTQSALPAALLCRMAGVPLRLAHARENPYALLTDWMPDGDRLDAGMRHEVRRQLDLVAAIGAATDDTRLQFAIAGADRRRVQQRLAAAGLQARRGGGTAGAGFVLIHPGASAASRRWPAEEFGRAGALLARAGRPVVLCGGRADLAMLYEARATMLALGEAPAATCIDDTTLGEMAALVEAAAVLIANNSAPAHIAAAVGTPVVGLYALTNPQHTPWQVPGRVLSHDVACRWCLKSACPQGHHLCLRGVDAAAVVAATLELLDEAPATAAMAVSPPVAHVAPAAPVVSVAPVTSFAPLGPPAAAVPAPRA